MRVWYQTAPPHFSRLARPIRENGTHPDAGAAIARPAHLIEALNCGSVA